MIVDDEKLICKLVQALVEWDKLGMQMAAQAENAIQALDMLQQYRPDILITDIRMPGMDGLELIKNAKKICPELEIIIISGYAHFEYARNALSLGVGNYLLKPIKQDELNETLRKIGERLDAKKSAQGMEMAERRVSESDVNRLRYALLKDLVEDAYNPTAVQLQENYYFKAEADCYQAIVVKAGYDPEQMSKAAQTVICEKTKELFYHCLSKNCNDCLFDYVKDSGYGILNFIKELNNTNDGIKIKVTEKIESLHHQDYNGKRVYIQLTDKKKYSINSSMVPTVRGATGSSKLSTLAMWGPARVKDCFLELPKQMPAILPSLQEMRASSTAPQSTLKSTRWMGSISMAGEWTLHTSARHQRAGWFAACSGVRVFFSSSQQAFAVASEWLPSPTASVRGLAPLASGYLASKASWLPRPCRAASIRASRAGSSTAQPAIWPPPSISSPSYTLRSSFLRAPMGSMRVQAGSSANIITWGVSRQAPRRTAMRGGMRSSTVRSLGRMAWRAPWA